MGVSVSTSLIVLTSVVAVAAAIRSIWSPCGLSMLSTITPMAEAGRGHQFRSTSVWFVAGSILGGATLGGLMAALAAGVTAIDLTAATSLWIVTVAALIAAASDGRVGGFHLPGHDRQVNERWLDRYRPWVYGAGFGWQIGVGLATYIMTAGVYLLIVMGGLTSPLVALAIGGGFGLVRGLAVYLAAGLDSNEKLLAFHSKFEARREPIRQSMIVVEVVVGIVAAALAGAPPPALLFVIVAGAGIVVMSLRGIRESVYLNAAPAR
jgi:hypothetical protein